MEKLPELKAKGAGEQAGRMPADIGFFEGIRFGSIVKRSERIRAGIFTGRLKGEPVQVDADRNDSGLSISMTKTGSGAIVRTEIEFTFDEMRGSDDTRPQVTAIRERLKPGGEGEEPQVLERLSYRASNFPYDNTWGLGRVSEAVKDVIALQEAADTIQQHP